MTPDRITHLNWDKCDGLIPAIIQNAHTGRVLMLGFMNIEALNHTIESGLVTFYSRTKRRLWTKGESSGHVLNVVKIEVDCDDDSLLILANPVGPTCHNGTQSCFGDDISAESETTAFLNELESVITRRIADKPEDSYTAKLWERGLTRMAQKVGEEGVEIALAAVVQDKDRLISESADMLYHLTLLLKARELSLGDVVKELEQRHKAKA